MRADFSIAQDTDVGRVVIAVAAFAAALSFAPSSASAGQVEGLYEASVTVSSQDARERERALRSALLQVVVRASGQRRVAPTGVLSTALQNPTRYVQEFGYGAPPGATSAPAAPSGQQRLWARFEPAAVNRLLRQAGLPVWGQSRPTTVVWIAVEREGQQDLVRASETDPLARTIRSRGGSRGVNLTLASPDAQDGVRTEDVWNEQVDRVVAASRRYRGDAVLLGRARERVPGLWETRWTLVAGGASERFTVDGEHLEKVVGEAVDRAVDTLAARTVQPGPGPSAAEAPAEGPLPALLVAGVDRLEDYLRLRRYLEGVDGVSSVHLVRLEPGRAVFQLTARTGRAELTRAVALDRMLTPVEGSVDWLFQLVP